MGPKQTDESARRGSKGGLPVDSYQQSPVPHGGGPKLPAERRDTHVPRCGRGKAEQGRRLSPERRGCGGQMALGLLGQISGADSLTV